MRKVFLISGLSLVLMTIMAQVPRNEVDVGIVEHLGDTIPLELKFYNENNDTVTLGEIITKPTIFSFVYFDCPGLCSPLLAGVSDAIEKVDMKLGEEYQVVTISFNTKDDPEKARQKKLNFVQNISKEHQADWVYLTGEQESIDRITDAIGYKYKPQGFDFSHPSAIVLVSPHGKITRYLYGLSYLPFDVKMAIIEAQQGIPRPTINRILEYCFAYEPASQTYGLQITKVIGAMTLLILGITLTILLLKPKVKRQKPAQQ